MNAPIKRHPALIPLSHDHQTGLLLAMILKKDTPQYRGMPGTTEGKLKLLQQRFQDELKPHFDKEENILFPMITGRNEEIDVLIDELIGEHNTLSLLIGEAKPGPTLYDDIDRIGNLLDNHIRKEERRLFQLVQVNFSEEELVEIGSSLVNESR
ncbi:MAG TPA: hemerythrin domain-containing protein [Bacteroidia bacterium]|nr:hemerythrin domain-containing protein [Bacteroidia bacterium]